MDNSNNPNTSFDVYANNVGEYLVANVKIDDKYEALIKPGEEKKFRIESTVEGGGYNDFLIVTACDVIGNEYIWRYQLQEVAGVRTERDKDTKRYYYRIVEKELR